MLGNSSTMSTAVICFVAGAMFLFVSFSSSNNLALSSVVRSSRVQQPHFVACNGRGRAARHLDFRVRASQEEFSQMNRRNMMIGVASSAIGTAVAPASMAKGVKGFQQHKDTGDRYEFLYPFGWEEIYVKGTDILYKDIIEPLETASVTVIETEKKSITEYGDIQDVTGSLAEKVLTPPGQAVKMLSAKERQDGGKTYYQFEFTAKNNRYTRHSLVSAAINNGKYYIFVTSANERRWNIMGDRLKKVADSFKLSN
eukprot:jgi/Bigna1/92237/estExt_fgenesh1_pm.C_80028